MVWLFTITFKQCWTEDLIGPDCVVLNISKNTERHLVFSYKLWYDTVPFKFQTGMQKNEENLSSSVQSVTENGVISLIYYHRTPLLMF